ncbi:MAG: hypothetical protein JST80_00620 [Bdellovibrionales bacterium]|nr:hypothetical protein [Bdellovibrionales bacterium]
MFNKVSKTLLSTFALSILFLSLNAEAKKPTVYLSDDEKASVPNCNDPDVDVEIGDICQDKKGHYIVVDAVGVTKEKKGFLGIGNKHTSLSGVTGHEVTIISEKASVSKKKKRSGTDNEPGDYDDVTITSIDETTVEICVKTTRKCTQQKVTVKDKTPPTDNGGGSKRRGGNVDVLVVNNGGTGGRRSRDPRVSAKAEFQMLFDFCSGEVEDLYDDVDNITKARAADVTKYEGEVADKKAVLDTAKAAEAEALKNMYTGCHNVCAGLATDPGADPAKPDPCYIKPTDRKNYDVLLDNLLKSDVEGQNTRGDRIRSYVGGQPAEAAGRINGRTAADDPTALCSMLAHIQACAAVIKSSNAFDGCGGKEWLAASADLDAAQKDYNDAKTNLADAQAAVAKLNSTESCTVRSASDVARVRNCGGRKCLEQARDSCPRAVADADSQLQIIMRTPYCATCGYDGGGSGGCQYGYGCSGGVSKAAQMISAIGGVAVPLGLGIMNMAMWNKGFNTCNSMYGKALEVSKTVGLPPPAPSCGGMGGFGGGFGGIGMGGGLNGMGMMGMNPYGMGGMYNPYGMGLNGGISAGIGLGFGTGMPGMYNPYGSGVYGGLGGGLYGGINPYGMGGMGMGMGGMGMMNPYANQYGVQQQMMDAQMRMQQMANQNMVLQQSQMMGGMYGQMGGMYGMTGSPYFNMGAYGGVNPYMNGSVMGNFTMNPWAYVNSGMMNPYMYGGGGAGISGGISAGLNLGFGTGYNTGGMNPYAMYGNYGSYPSMATPPYVGYGMYNSGYGPYGNYGIPAQTGLPAGNCGWQVGVQCGGVGGGW